VIFFVAFYVIFISSDIILSGLLSSVVLFPGLLTLSILLIICIPVYRHVKGKTRIEFYEDRVRFFQKTGNPVEIPYSDMTLELKPKIQITRTYIMCILSTKASANRQSWEIPDHIVWKYEITLDKWLKSKMDVVGVSPRIIRS